MSRPPSLSPSAAKTLLLVTLQLTLAISLVSTGFQLQRAAASEREQRVHRPVRSKEKDSIGRRDKTRYIALRVVSRGW